MEEKENIYFLKIFDPNSYPWLLFHETNMKAWKPNITTEFLPLVHETKRKKQKKKGFGEPYLLFINPFAKSMNHTLISQKDTATLRDEDVVCR